MLGDHQNHGDQTYVNLQSHVRGQVRYAAASRDQPQVVVRFRQQGSSTAVEVREHEPRAH
jgi:hypothetical protein